MINPVLSPDTQAILLLCASFGQNRLSHPQPLTLSEYNILAGWLQENQMRPGDLLNPTAKNKLQKITLDKLDPHRIEALLERGVMLSLAVEKWTAQGIWILGRGDSQYPKRLKQKLKQKSPAILYGIGSIELLSTGGLAIVGSRDINEEEIDYTQRVAKTCAEQEIQVISGGARGVDQVSMLGVLEASGTAVGVLADSLIKTAVNGKYRNSISEGRLTLISPYDPNAGFNTGNAMGRNKYIYALADYALVVSSAYEKGGTWAGAKEALEKIKDVPVFVRMQDTVPKGNQQLVKRGAKPFPIIPASSLRGGLRTLLEAATTEVEAIKTDMEVTTSLRAKETSSNSVTETSKLVNQLSLEALASASPSDKALVVESDFSQNSVTETNPQTIQLNLENIPEAIPSESLEGVKKDAPQGLVTDTPSEVIQVSPKDMEKATDSKPDFEVTKDASDSEVTETIPKGFPIIPKDIYEAVLPFILVHLNQPLDAKSLAERLEVRQGQIQDWLNRAVAEGKVRKTKKPVAYVVDRQAAQLFLLREAE